MSICTTEWVKGVILSLLLSPVWFSVGWWWWIWALGCMWGREVLSSFLVAAMDFNQFPHPADFLLLLFSDPELYCQPWVRALAIQLTALAVSLRRASQAVPVHALEQLGSSGHQSSAATPVCILTRLNEFTYRHCFLWEYRRLCVLSASCSSLCVFCLLPCFPGMD